MCGSVRKKENCKMVGISHKLKASTLVESIIAMVIITLCLSIGVMIYINVINADKQLSSQKASFILANEANRIKTEKNFISTTTNINEWMIEKDISKYEGTENVYLLKLILKDANNKVISIHNELFLKEE